MLAAVTITTPVGWLLIAYLLVGIGNAAVGAPISHTAVSGMPPAQAGLAAGVSSASRQVGATLGVAIAGVILATGNRTHGITGVVDADRPGWWLIAVYGAVVLALGFLVTSAWALETADSTARLLGGTEITPQSA